MEALKQRLLGLARSPTLVYTLGTGLSRLGMLVLIPVYVKAFTQAEYGDYSLIQTAVALLMTVATLGLVTAIPKAYFSHKSDVDGTRAVGSVAAWILVFGLASMAVLQGVAWIIPVRPGASIGAWERTCVIVAFFGFTITTIPGTMLRSARKAKRAVLFQLLEFTSVTLLGYLFVASLHRGFRGAVEAYALAYGGCGVVSVIYLARTTRLSLRIDALRDFLGPSLHLVPHLLGAWLLAASDRWVLKALGLHREIGVYALAFQCVSPILLITASWHDAGSAKFAASFRESGVAGMKRAIGGMRRSYLLSGALPGLALVALVLPFPDVFGERFVEALRLVPFLVAIHLVDTQYFSGADVLYYAGKTGWISAVTAVTSVCQIGLNFALDPRLGLTGLIIARLASSGLRAGALATLARTCFARDQAASAIAKSSEASQE